MTYSQHNLANTVENRPRYETLPCAVVRCCKPPYEHIETRYHEWPNRDGGLSGGCCIHCGLTLKQVRVRVNPKTGKPVRRSGSLARAIATMHPDVPPVRFIDSRCAPEEWR